MTLVLIVDDNPMDRRLAGGFVEQSGMTVDYAEDGEQALQKLNENKPDIVLTDLDMPVMNGLELVTKLRKRAPLLPVILMTAKGSEEIASEALRAGASSYVRKRHLQNELDAALRVVRNASSARERKQDFFRYLSNSHMEFQIGNDHQAAITLVSFFQDYLENVNLCPEEHLLVVGTALLESLLNAIDHGNLELTGLTEEEKDNVRKQRAALDPFQSRKVSVIMDVTEHAATFVVRDEGGGFDTGPYSDLSDPSNLTEDVGRGLVLIHSFMDQVSFNEKGNEITMQVHAFAVDSEPVEPESTESESTESESDS